MLAHEVFHYDYACVTKATINISAVAKAVSSYALVDGASIVDQRYRWPGHPDTCVDRQLTASKRPNQELPGRGTRGLGRKGQVGHGHGRRVKSVEQALADPQIFAFDSLETLNNFNLPP